MATIDKAVELLEKVLEENYKLSEGYEIKPETRDEIEEWIKWYNDYKTRGEGEPTNENSGLHLQRVVFSEERAEVCDCPLSFRKYPDQWSNKERCSRCGKVF